MLLLAALVWGIAFVAQSEGLNYVETFTFNTCRFLLGGAVLIPCIFFMHGRKDSIWQTLSEKEKKEQTRMGSTGGAVGYIEIPAIKLSLPIYLGTSESVLQAGVGTMEGSSLPIGGESTHAVLTGHRGLPSATLFTNLDQLVLGDTFHVHVLNETCSYEVDQILIVEPEDLAALEIVEGEDYCTLVTCTPYGINTHRMLIRGHRVETPDDVIYTQVSADALQIDPLLIAPLVAAPLLVLLLVWMLGGGRHKPRKSNQTEAKKGGNTGDDNPNATD